MPARKAHYPNHRWLGTRMAKSPNAFNDPVLFAVWITVVAGCLWAVVAAWEKGWIVGLPIAIALGATRVLVFEAAKGTEPTDKSRGQEKLR